MIHHQFPEATLLLVNGLALAVAYGRVYPRMPLDRSGPLARTALLMGCAPLLLAALLFAGSGVRFGLFGLSLPWFGFSLLTLILLETPLFISLARRHKFFSSRE